MRITHINYFFSPKLSLNQILHQASISEAQNYYNSPNFMVTQAWKNLINKYYNVLVKQDVQYIIITA